MKDRYEIIPGESIGPFKLGMSRAEIENLNIRPMEEFKDRSGVEFPTLGVKVHYDESGQCKQIEACVFSVSADMAGFTLAGRLVNDISEHDAKELFRSISSNIRFFYGGFELPSAGLKALKWENSDDFIYAILVELPHERN